MTRPSNGRRTARTCCVSLACIFAAAATAAHATALDDYVAAPDNHYAYSLVNTIPFATSGCTAYVYDLTSQAWRSAAEVRADEVVWHHWLTVFVPTQLQHDTALLHINAGDNGSSPPGATYPLFPFLALLAGSTGSVVADLQMVPNQPLHFTDETRDRSEDAIIAYSFHKYAQTGDPNWPVLLPMVKSAVRAMDTIQTVVQAGPIDHFVVAGASKRGWATWLTAAADQRVTGIIPIVIDVLNMDEQIHHHFSAYGFYSYAIQDYVEMGVFDLYGTPTGDMLLQIVDPYEYRDRLTLPQYIINATGDQFFLPDSSQFYLHDLPTTPAQLSHLRYLPNTDHMLGGSLITPFSAASVYYYALLNGLPLPRYSWTVRPDGALEVQATDLPDEVNLWQATNPNARNFRLDAIGAAWTSTSLAPQSPGLYVATLPEPPTGWTAFFVELKYNWTDPYGVNLDYTFTTEVSVVPFYRPFACDFNRDGIVNFLDLQHFADAWLTTPAPLDADVYPFKQGDDFVDFADWDVLRRSWLNTP